MHLIYSQSFATREEALAAERQIKGWSRRKKEALITGTDRIIKSCQEKKQKTLFALPFETRYYVALLRANGWWLPVSWVNRIFIYSTKPFVGEVKKQFK